MVAPASVHKNPRIYGFSQEARNSKPVALVVYPEADHNGAFSKIKVETSNFKKHGYNVVYVKCAKDQDVFDAIRRVGGVGSIRYRCYILVGMGTLKTRNLGRAAMKAVF